MNTQFAHLFSNLSTLSASLPERVSRDADATVIELAAHEVSCIGGGEAITNAF